MLQEAKLRLKKGDVLQLVGAKKLSSSFEHLSFMIHLDNFVKAGFRQAPEQLRHKAAKVRSHPR